MAAELEEIQKHYHEHLKPDVYNQTLLDALPHLRTEFTTALTAIYKTLKSGKHQGRRMLEVGSGATVHNIASASAHFEEIIQSDFVDANCQELKKWLKGESQLDWSDYLKVVAEIEGYSDLDQGVNELSSRIRRRVKNVVHCDVMLDQVVPAEVGKDFDVVSSSLILEAAATDFNSYVQVLRRLHGLLRPGGLLIMVGFLNGAKWKTGDEEFHHIRLDQGEIERALELANFSIQEMIIIPKGTGDPGYEYDNLYFAASVSI